MTEQTIEIAPDILETLTIPEYVDNNYVKEQPETVYRLDFKGHRYYYTLSEKGEPTFYTSVTTFIKQSLPTSPHLVQWMVEQGANHADVAKDRAFYGTFMHIQCSELLKNRKYNLDDLRSILMEYVEEHHLPYSFMDYADELKKDILAFSQFVVDYNVVPIAIELVLTDKENLLAGAIDLVAEMDVEVTELSDVKFKSGPRAGKFKPHKVKRRMICIIDLKSGRKGFFEGHEIQLAQYKNMFEMNFPDITIDRLFNFAPKDWRGTPSYSLKDQTDAKSAEKLYHLIGIASIEDSKRLNRISVYHGEINLDYGVLRNIEHVDMSEMIRKRHAINL